MKTPTIPVAREGYPFIFLAAFATLTCALLRYDLVALAGLLLTSFVLYFFRDPVRITPPEPGCLLAPADGKVILIDRICDARFAEGEVQKISIFMNVFNVHVNRLPLAGTVERITLQPGRFYCADNNKAALHNEYCALTIRSGENLRYTVVQMAGLIARRIVCWAETGDVLRSGERFGLIRFGSRVDLYLPLQMKLEVTVGQKVTAGETILGSVTTQVSA